jgi:hypothetical protein
VLVLPLIPDDADTVDCVRTSGDRGGVAVAAAVEDVDADDDTRVDTRERREGVVFGAEAVSLALRIGLFFVSCWILSLFVGFSCSAFVMRRLVNISPLSLRS